MNQKSLEKKQNRYKNLEKREEKTEVNIRKQQMGKSGSHPSSPRQKATPLHSQLTPDPIQSKLAEKINKFRL